jgi:hypothetical protein
MIITAFWQRARQHENTGYCETNAIFAGENGVGLSSKHDLRSCQQAFARLKKTALIKKPECKI